jgi:hypothetical protein
MEPSTKENGRKTSNMGMEKKHGLMVPAIKVITEMAKRMATENSNGQMAPPIMASSLTIISMVRVHTRGLMTEPSQVIGKITKCTEGEYSHGQMVESTMESILMIRSKVLVFSFGLMAEGMKASGLMGNNMAEALTLQVKEKLSLANGKMVKE